MATIVPGYTFGATEIVTNTKLAALASGTVTGITQSDVTDTVIVTGTSPPTAATGRMWFDTNNGAGRGILRVYDNGVWTAVAEGFIGYNNGLAVARGAPVVFDPTFASGSTAGRVAFRRCTAPTANSVQMDRVIGVCGEFSGIANGATGIILTEGYATALKDAASITAGDPACPSVSTSAQATTGALGSWGYPQGSAFGRWLDTSAASAGTEVAVYLQGAAQKASWLVYKNSGGTTVFNAAIPATNDTWSGSYGTPQLGTFASAPVGTIAHICQCKITSSTAAGTVERIAFGLRAQNATITIDTGAAFAGGLYHSGGATPTNGQAFRCTLLVQETTGASSNKIEYYVETGDTIGNLKVSVIEVGVLVGGQIA